MKNSLVKFPPFLLAPILQERFLKTSFVPFDRAQLVHRIIMQTVCLEIYKSHNEDAAWNFSRRVHMIARKKEQWRAQEYCWISIMLETKRYIYWTENRKVENLKERWSKIGNLSIL